MCATTSLPTPLSPVSRTFASERAASLISDSRYRVTGDFPIRSSPDTTCLTPGAVLSCVVCEHREPVRPSGETDTRPQQSQPVAQLTDCALSEEINRSCALLQAFSSLQS